MTMRSPAIQADLDATAILLSTRTIIELSEYSKLVPEKSPARILSNYS
jgi:hypothetical protein